MATFSGTVRDGRFDNDDGTGLQRLTRASLQDGEDGWVRAEIYLDDREGQQLTVDGEWQREWILNASIRNDSAGNRSAENA